MNCYFYPPPSTHFDSYSTHPLYIYIDCGRWGRALVIINFNCNLSYETKQYFQYHHILVLRYKALILINYEITSNLTIELFKKRYVYLMFSLCLYYEPFDPINSVFGIPVSSYYLTSQYTKAINFMLSVSVVTFDSTTRTIIYFTTFLMIILSIIWQITFSSPVGLQWYH